MLFFAIAAAGVTGISLLPFFFPFPGGAALALHLSTLCICLAAATGLLGLYLHNRPFFKARRVFQTALFVVTGATLILATVAGIRAGESLRKRGVVPHIIGTDPAFDAKDVQPGAYELRVTFDRDMEPSYSWCQQSPSSFPRMASGADPVWENKRVCRLKVLLEPGKTYTVWLNQGNYLGFTAAGGSALPPTLLSFTTAPVRTTGNPVSAPKAP